MNASASTTTKKTNCEPFYRAAGRLLDVREWLEMPEVGRCPRK